MNMNINPVGFQSKKLPISRIKIANKVDNYVEQMVNQYSGALENNAAAYGRDITLAQRKGNGVNALYVNSGSITSKIDLEKMLHCKEFYEGIVNNLKANHEASTKGLAKGFERVM